MNIFLKRKSFKWQKILVGVTMLLLFIGFLNYFQEPVKNSAYFIVSPFTKIFWRAGNIVLGFFESFAKTQSLKKDNDDLKKENQELLAKITSLQDGIKANQSLKEALQNTKDDKISIVHGRIIGLNAVMDYLLLDKGFDDGLKVNMPVISQQKVLYGKVSHVYKNFSEVMLISNKNSVLNAKIRSDDLSQAQILGAVKGSGNLSLYLDLVSPDAKINHGDILITSGLEGLFPKDLLVGKITSNNKSDAKPFQTAKVSPFFDVNRIENLFVITNYKQEK